MMLDQMDTKTRTFEVSKSFLACVYQILTKASAVFSV